MIDPIRFLEEKACQR